MKVTTELKNLIKRHFEEMKQERIKINKEERRKIHDERAAEIENSSEFKNYVEAAKMLYEYLKPDYEEKGHGAWNDNKLNTVPYYYNQGYFSSLLEIKGTNFIWENGRFNANVETTDLTRAQEGLLIKLTYEKDIEVIKSLLSEYGIEL